MRQQQIGYRSSTKGEVKMKKRAEIFELAGRLLDVMEETPLDKAERSVALAIARDVESLKPDVVIGEDRQSHET
jgi:hypothetical protein